MPVFELDKHDIVFPPAYLADNSGLLAIGGDLSPERLLSAYKMGIFPWFNPNEPILWWSPNPRFVIIPEEIKVSKSMKQVLRSDKFKVTFDQNFHGVIEGCQSVPRPGQQGTWISEEIIDSYYELFKRGFIHTVEVWHEDELVGGLYGGVLGKCFFGESMFAKMSNASKVGFITLAKNLHEFGFEIIDCQVYTNHLESLGARMIPRMQFLNKVEANSHSIPEQAEWGSKFKTRFNY
ncbi:leucyl/phenylalanyl-tRNA--protein transferase [Chondrinema litorale]|uniref:leucyl/phenylalanyl-tRNA--protein transferase n=1 Tax=Chondrinema litorale TaxID=2994555 RepID=UPI00254442AD|nr:leucyl/phenylalanyl-tRNA--protein transferase [Chondrinema litorale]UZR93682.1 leucyl/phenylalanyl-tRNA--protein transferase [Chondrinema litorale]